MGRQIKGFSLIEILLVVLIIGILAALLLPEFISSVQKTKQKGTMQDMNTVAKAITDYVMDHGFAPEQNGPLVANSSFSSAMGSLYLKVLPLNDQWGSPFYIYCGSEAVSSAAIDGVTASGEDDFLVVSYGRDRRQTAFTFDPLDPHSAYFPLTTLTSFDQDLIIWNGAWIHVPKTSQIGN
jgi:type II secretion system protein G